jgi:hypothetical protein
MQNNHYYSSQNPHLTQEVPLHPLKVGVWCAVSARETVVPVFFNETINCERYLCVEGQHFQHLLRSVNCNYFIPNIIGHQACSFISKIRMRLTVSGTLVTMKQRALELVNKTKILPVVSVMNHVGRCRDITSPLRINCMHFVQRMHKNIIVYKCNTYI